MSRDLAEAANENLRRGIVRLADHVGGGETRQFGPLTAASSGLPVPIFNRLFVFDPPPREAFATAVSWLDDRGAPYWVTVAEPAVGAVDPPADGLAAAATQPGMAMASLDDLSTATSVVEIDEVTDRRDLEAFSDVSSSVFGMPRTVAERVDETALSLDGVRSFLGRVDGEPAGCGTLIRTGDVAGVYTIGVREAFRRRGIGEAMSWAVLRAGREAGCTVGVLQSSEMAYPLYEEMGFEPVVTYHLYEPEP